MAAMAPARADLRGYRRSSAAIGCSLLADQQVRVAAVRPALVAVAQPLAGQGGGDLIEVDDPALVPSPYGQRAGGQVEVGCLEPDQVGFGQGVGTVLADARGASYSASSDWS